MTTEDLSLESTKTSSEAVLNKETETVTKMRDSDIKWRAKYKLTKEELEDLRAKAEQEQTSLKQTIDTTLKERVRVEEKLIDAKLEAVAVSAGITDLDLVKLIDKSGLKLTETGEISGLQEAVQAFKQAKPNFFGAEKKVSSSTNAPLPSEGTPKLVRAMDMSPEEWQKQKHKITTRQRI